MIEVIALGFLVAGTIFSVTWSGRVFLYYCFVFIAFATYFVAGLSAAWLVPLGGTVGAALLRLRSGGPSTKDRLVSLFTAAVASTSAIVITHGARWLLGHRAYPLPMGTSREVGVFTLTLLFLFGVYVAFKEALMWITGARKPSEDSAKAFGRAPALYAVSSVIGFPMHVAAQAVYAQESYAPWVGVLLWSVMLNGVIQREATRANQLYALMQQLAAKERLAAIGEVTARIAHQTRHQLALIGIIVHRVERRLKGLSEADSAVVHGELDKLREVQTELSAMLAQELRGPSSPAATEDRVSWSAIVTAVVRRLDALATLRGVHVDAGDVGEVAAGVFPHNPANASSAVFNLLENAIVAASRSVRLDARIEGSDLRIRVNDDGPGMPEELLRRALEPFVTTKPDGTGMGLAIARAVIDEEGGVLSLANGREGGLCVDVVLPVSGRTHDERHARR